VCGAKNFVSVRLYSAPQSHWTIVAILGICAYGLRDQAEFVAKIKQMIYSDAALTIAKVPHAAPDPATAAIAHALKHG
jgi:hypothetical protein